MKSRLLLIPAFVLLTLCGLSGCSEQTAGVGQTWAEADNDFRRVAYMDSQMLVDDFGLLFQTSRPSHTSRWFVD